MPWWPYYIRNDFVPFIDIFADCLRRHVLPSFENVSREADDVANVAFDRFLSHASEDADPGDFVDSAFSEGLEYYQTMTELAQGMRNLLYHLFEQQFLRFHRSELLDYQEENNPRFFSVEQAKARLVAHGIQIDLFRSWAKVDELKTLANAVKHADGRSCEELKRGSNSANRPTRRFRT
jgi:hypothetical protein